MSDDNQFQQYGYDHYLKAPKKNFDSAPGSFENVVGPKLRRLQSPLVVTSALLTVGVVFAGIIVSSYPSAKNDQQEIPIIRADLRPVKSLPEERGGLDIPHKDNTLFADAGKPQDYYSSPDESALSESETGGVENILQKTASASPEDFVSKEQVVAAATAENTGSENKIVNEASYAMEDAGTKAVEDIASVSELESPGPSDILRKIEPSDETMTIAAATETAAITTETKAVPSVATANEENMAPQQERPVIHAAATSPETIDFVRSVMKEKEAQATKAEAVAVEPAIETAPLETADAPIALVEESVVEEISLAKSKPVESAKAPEKVEPAAGAASVSAGTFSGDQYFVQLSSITDSARAESEWTKFKASYSVLSGAQHRVEKADVAGRGTFYRIQAGPFSKSDAHSVCDSIRAQNSGGCLVVR